VIELLSPAGDLERLKIATLYGADAVYVGGKDYSLRANAKNFSIEDLKEATNFVHSLGKKIYVTVNIVPHNKDVFGIKEYLLALDKIGIDAIIVSDIYIMSLHKNLNLKMELHISTQASTMNKYAATFYKNLGAKRVVLARECSKEDIIEIKKYTNLDLEGFIHGAMCTSISGRCVMSNYATNRDSNRGGCSQVCRYVFNMDNKSIPFTMMSKDLNMSIYIKDMMDIGINSFKVEGRMRSIYYIATVINTYKNIFDKIKNNTLDKKYLEYATKILNRCANRESVPQFFIEKPTDKEQYYQDRNEISNQDFLGIVLSYDKEAKELIVEERNFFKKGDVIEVISPTKEAVTLTIPDVYDEEGNLLEVARHPREIVKFKCDIEFSKYDMLRIKVFDI